MPRFTINKHYNEATPSMSISISSSRDATTCDLAFITSPVTQGLVDDLRSAAKQASEALEAWEEVQKDRVA